MTFWLGRLGALTALPGVLPGATPAATRQSTVKATIGGGQAVSHAPGSGRRTYRLGWHHLDPDTYTLLEEYFAAGRGGGPYALLDPLRRNHLTANQSSSTASGNNTTGYTALGGAEVLASALAPVTGLRVPRMLRWSLPPAGATGVLRLDPPPGLSGTPAPPGQPWTFSVQLLGGGVNAAVNATAALLWMDAAGVAVATTAGAPVALSGAALAQASVTALTPPPGAACVQAEVRLDLASVSAQWSGFGDAPVRSGWLSSRTLRQQAIGSPLAATLSDYAWGGGTVDLYVGQPQLDMSAAVRAWVIGTGVPQVSVLDLSPAYDTFAPNASFTATLVEVG